METINDNLKACKKEIFQLKVQKEHFELMCESIKKQKEDFEK